MTGEFWIGCGGADLLQEGRQYAQCCSRYSITSNKSAEAKGNGLGRRKETDDDQHSNGTPTCSTTFRVWGRFDIGVQSGSDHDQRRCRRQHSTGSPFPQDICAVRCRWLQRCRGCCHIPSVMLCVSGLPTLNLGMKKGGRYFLDMTEIPHQSVHRTCHLPQEHKVKSRLYEDCVGRACYLNGVVASRCFRHSV